ncbi:hypothetical protein CA13_56270 [Planctomycetes bacterium CA13]|uniref:Bacterial type II/III secretion system short domain protein n=1 Tax=Novipirellula herctigrandis TaxID=2527986 RepID=A0A5C5ZBA7_9BACT|nr:hypothetical protein CA13_56270 [Planctomycetes bacterium CA13]
MRQNPLLCASCFLALIPHISWGQNEDPFGQPPRSNGQPAMQDPFGGGGGRSDDPFGGGGGRSDDPFGGPAAHSDRSSRDPFAPVIPAASTPVDLTTRRISTTSRAEKMLLEKLGDKTSMTFIETPLVEAVQEISQQHGIQMFVDQRSFEEIGLTDDTPVTLDVANVSLRSCLNLLLRDLDSTYVVRDEVLLITTIEAAEQMLALRTYAFPKALSSKADQVVAIMLKTVKPNDWDELGGYCSAGAVENVLVVSATEEVHEAVIEFLVKLEAAFNARQ